MVFFGGPLFPFGLFLAKSGWGRSEDGLREALEGKGGEKGLMLLVNCLGGGWRRVGGRFDSNRTGWLVGGHAGDIFGGNCRTEGLFHMMREISSDSLLRFGESQIPTADLLETW